MYAVMKYLNDVNETKSTGSALSNNRISGGTLPAREGMRTSTKIFLATGIFFVVMLTIKIVGGA